MKFIRVILQVIRQSQDKRLLVGYLIMAGVFFSSAVFGAVANTNSTATDPVDQRTTRVFTLTELSAFDGVDGRPAYYGYEGQVYDVTTSSLFREGKHFGHTAGIDLTEALSGAPHGTESFEGFDIVGVLAGSELDTSASPTPSTTSSTRTRGDFLIIGKNLTAWSGYIFALVMILNFATCYVMPWCTKFVPWHGTTPGPDKYDATLLRFSFYHRYFAWLTIIFGIIHGVLGIFQSFGIRI